MAPTLVRGGHIGEQCCLVVGGAVLITLLLRDVNLKYPFSRHL